jgi:hypothetical protein
LYVECVRGECTEDEEEGLCSRWVKVWWLCEVRKIAVYSTLDGGEGIPFVIDAAAKRHRGLDPCSVGVEE